MLSFHSARIRHVTLLAAVLLVCSAAMSIAKDKEYSDPNWPCISRKVAEISPAQIWDGPGLDAASEWQSDDEIRKLTAYLSSPATPRAWP